MERVIEPRSTPQRAALLIVMVVYAGVAVWFLYEMVSLSLHWSDPATRWILLVPPVALTITMAVGAFFLARQLRHPAPYKLSELGIQAPGAAFLPWTEVSGLSLARPSFLSSTSELTIRLCGGETGLGTYLVGISPRLLGLEATAALASEFGGFVPGAVVSPAFLVLARLAMTASQEAVTASLPRRAAKALAAVNVGAAARALRDSGDRMGRLLGAQSSYLARKPKEALAAIEPLLGSGDPDAVLVAALSAFDLGDLARSAALLATLRDSKYAPVLASFEARLAAGEPSLEPAKPRTSVVLQTALVIFVLLSVALRLAQAFRR